MGDQIRYIDPYYFVSFIVAILEAFTDKWDYVLLPDLRLKDEVKIMKQCAFDCTTVRVTRNNFENNLTEEQRKHISEVDLDSYEFDYRIIVDNDIASLKTAVSQTITDIIMKDVLK